MDKHCIFFSFSVTYAHTFGLLVHCYTHTLRQTSTVTLNISATQTLCHTFNPVAYGWFLREGDVSVAQSAS